MKYLLKILSISSLLASTTLYADPAFLIQGPIPHFYLQMQNQSGKDVKISFQHDQGDVQLSPSLADDTLLPAYQDSASYGVVFSHISKDDAFSILFKGKNTCEYKVEFYAPGDPKITIQGLGCAGGGYKLNGSTLILYIADIY